MRELLKYFWTVFVVIGITSCGEPSPTELIDDTVENVEIKIISDKPSVYDYTNGYDSTGIFDPFIDKSSIISVSGIRNTNYGFLSKDEYYFAQFNDKTKPVYLSGNRLLGYKTKSVASVRFDNIQAQVVPHMMSFRYNNMRKDTALGLKYVVLSKMMPHGATANFPYNSKVNFKLDGGRNVNIQFDIPTPPEVVGEVRTQGSFANRTFKMDLAWNGRGTMWNDGYGGMGGNGNDGMRSGSGQIEIILGTIAMQSTQPTPLLKLVGPDNGKMSIQQNILEKIPFSQNRFLVVTFIRRFIKEIPNNDILLNDNYIAAQSIHNIKIQIPR